MNADYINNYTEEEFEDIQFHFDGKAEFDKGRKYFTYEKFGVLEDKLKRHL